MAITFENPAFLMFFIGIPFLIIGHFIALRFTKKRALRFSNFDAISRVTHVEALPKNITILVLRIIIVSSIILSAAGTTISYMGDISGFDYVIAIDTSNSMLAEDFSPNRLEAAKNNAIQLVQNIKGGTKIGVISFAGSSVVELRPTTDMQTAAQTISELSIKNIGGTNIGEVIITAANLFDKESEDKAIILLTDGQGNVGTTNDKAINYAKENNIKVFPIAVATDEGIFAELNVSLTVDDEALEKIATETEGEYYKAINEVEVVQAYAKLTETKKAVRIKNIAMYLMLLALVLMFSEWLLLKTSYSSIP